MSDTTTAPKHLGVITTILATACGLAVANLYYAQPLLNLIAHSYNVSQGAATAVITATQVGYAAGLVFLLPLGDLYDTRKLASRTLIATGIALVIAALAPNLTVFLVMSILVGVTSVVAQILIPFAAHLAPEAERGRFVGRVMSGLLLGILLARTVASFAAAAWGWRSIYLISAVLMFVVSFGLWKVLPNRTPDAKGTTYRSLMRSVARLAREEPVLRRRALVQAMLFGAFTSFWSAIAFELIKQHRFSQTEIGLFALVGAAGAAAAPIAGRLGDSGHSTQATIGALAIGLGSMILAHFSSHSVILLGLAGVLLDLAVQSHQVLSQRVIYALRPDARARVNTVFMGTVFIGGAASSAVTGALHDSYGWSGVTVFATALLAVAIAVWAYGASVTHE